MHADNGAGPVPDRGFEFRETVNYTVGGIIALGLIGWLVDIILLRTGWIWIAGAVLGAGLGYYLARQHRKARARDDRNTP
jgi:hypothetical protein